jgi:hypothetical protein
MDGWLLEQRINIKFSVKLGNNASDICTVLSISSRNQTTKFAMQPDYIPTTKESSHVEIINEENPHHFILYQASC